MPTYSVQGIGASILIEDFKESERSFFIFSILETFMPFEGFILNCITVGPTSYQAIFTGILNSSNFVFISFACSIKILSSIS